MNLIGLKKEIEDIKTKNPTINEDSLTIWERIDFSEKILKSHEYQRFKEYKQSGQSNEAARILEGRTDLEKKYYKQLYTFEVDYLDKLMEV